MYKHYMEFRALYEVILKFVKRHPLTRLNKTFSGRRTSQHMLYRRLTVRLRKD